MRLPIYLDYMATTPVDPRVAEKMRGCLTQDGTFGNPASQTHVYGWEAAQCVREAHEHVAALIHADPREIVWTSGATEANNLALIGAARFYQRQGKHIITMQTEHKAVLDACAYLATQGFEITYLSPLPNGLLDLDTLNAAIRADTILVSIMHVNNETGVIQDIPAIAAVVKNKGALLHVDAVQSAGKIAIDVQHWPVDLMSFSGHKIYGPKGIGVLYVRRNPRVHVEPLIYGGGHEGGLRSGTLATHQIVGMGEAFAIAKQSLSEDALHAKNLRTQFLLALASVGDIHINGESAPIWPGCINLYFIGVNGESLMTRLRDIAISSGSACNSANPNPSHVLRAMGLRAELAYDSLRISFGRFTTTADIHFAANHIQTEVAQLRKLSPIWASVQENVVRKIKETGK